MLSPTSTLELPPEVRRDSFAQRHFRRSKWAGFADRKSGPTALDRSQARGDVAAGYAVLFALCGSAYLVAFAVNHLLAPKFEPITL